MAKKLLRRLLIISIWCFQDVGDVRIFILTQRKIKRIIRPWNSVNSWIWSCKSRRKL